MVTNKCSRCRGSTSIHSTKTSFPMILQSWKFLGQVSNSTSTHSRFACPPKISCTLLADSVSCPVGEVWDFVSILLDRQMYLSLSRLCKTSSGCSYPDNRPFRLCQLFTNLHIHVPFRLLCRLLGRRHRLLPRGLRRSIRLSSRRWSLCSRRSHKLGGRMCSEKTTRYLHDGRSLPFLDQCYRQFRNHVIPHPSEFNVFRSHTNKSVYYHFITGTIHKCRGSV